MQLTTLMVVSGALASPSVALAAPCGAADFLSALPRDGATGVATNAVLEAHYTAAAVYQGESVVIEHGSEAPTEIAGDFDASESLLSVTFDEPLVSGDRYVVTWPRLHGADHGGLGKGGKVSFRAGSGPDLESPTFAGVSGLAWDVVRVHDDCTNSLEDRFAFDLDLSAAKDDGGRAALEVVVFQSSSEHGRGSEVLHEPIPASGDVVRVERAIGDATGRVCFSAIVRDLTGKFAGGDAPAVCTTTVPPPFFYGCRAANHEGPPSAGAETTALAVVLAALARKRRER